MTDKEQIIIDGVDVSGCSALCCGNACFLSQHYSFTEPKYKPFCVDNPTCDHKQLVRKMQEYEELKSESFTREELITLQEKDIDRYRKALEEIEEVLKDEICEECPGKEGCKGGCKEHQCLYIINKVKGGKDE